MNPWALVIIGIGILLIIIGVKGSYSNVIGALKSGGTSTTASSPPPPGARPRPSMSVA